MLYQPWPWYIAGPLIALVMAVLILMGKRFGMSSNLETFCSIGGAGKFTDYFKVDLKSRRWNLLVVLGSVIGGFLGAHLLSPNPAVQISEKTVTKLNELGFESAGTAYLPTELFSMEALTKPLVWIILLVAGFLVGFGTRYAGGCTSGHAISGLSNLQRPSLIAVIGFFIGGLIMVHVLFPLIFGS
ncbi:YeeE/YedE family protein [Flagellimonas pelagia]|uniref:YeeE/YedE family protein n=1 Tax=Flagellimonas pelagia TaxID=2306998 RepID=A0A3A1NLN2_9FLAO|nr:YeeE/YedE thiosulfate transporter family protein [Allomuricauda maritima]RIV46453.1 YeeE/YedE family protein [Allomuricauda maritima]TXJ99115.1 YeeE/YedE family protein [Allomuricauda maritima]